MIKNRFIQKFQLVPHEINILFLFHSIIHFPKFCKFIKIVINLQLNIFNKMISDSNLDTFLLK